LNGSKSIIANPILMKKVRVSLINRLVTGAFLVICTISLIPETVAQVEVTRSGNIQTINGKQFYIHIVEAHQTLYSISRAYGVTGEEIIIENPDAGRGLKAGQTLRIPVTGKEVPGKEPVPAMESTVKQGENFTRHLVQQGETFYSLSRKYNTTIGKLKDANPGVPYPKAGEYLKIPAAGVPDQKLNAGNLDYTGYNATSSESIYLLARNYRVDVDSIRAINPGIPDLIPAGMTIRIPNNQRNTDYILHHVTEQKTTIGDIAGKYGLEPQQVSDINPGAGKKVFKGQVLKIPLEKENKEAVMPVDTDLTAPGAHKDFTRCIGSVDNLKNTYHVALMIPLYIETFDTATHEESQSMQEVGKSETFRFIPFYQGVILAVDSLKKQGLNLELHVYDVDQEMSKAIMAVQAPEIQKMDIIIGPMYRNTFTYVANFARTLKIPIINPFSQHEDILPGYPNVFKVIPPRESQVDQLADLVVKRFPNDRIIIIRPNNTLDADIFTMIENSIGDAIHDRSRIYTVNFATDSLPGVRRSLSKVKPNLVITYTENEVLPTVLISRLSELRDSLDITLIGLPEWEKFEQLDVKDLLKFRTHFFTSSFIDYNDPGTRQYVMSFRNNFGFEPNGIAYAGFDVAYYFLGLLMSYGKDFQRCLDSYNARLPNTRFRFSPTLDGGFENDYWNIYRYEDYRMIRIEHR
jgi:LysM repeat protein